MKITTKDIIAYLGLDPEFKKNLEDKLNSLDADSQFEIVDSLWETYDQLFELRFQENLSEAIRKIGENSQSPEPNFYKKVRDETRKEIEAEMFSKTTDYNITALREKLRQIIDQKPTKIN